MIAAQAEEADEDFQEAVLAQAQALGMDPKEDAAFLWLAEEALKAELPPGWEMVVPEPNDDTNDGEQQQAPFYYNMATEESTWEHPLEAQYRERFLKLKAEREQQQQEQEEDEVEEIESIRKEEENVEQEQEEEQEENNRQEQRPSSPAPAGSKDPPPPASVRTPRSSPLPPPPRQHAARSPSPPPPRVPPLPRLSSSSSSPVPSPSSAEASKTLAGLEALLQDMTQQLEAERGRSASLQQAVARLQGRLETERLDWEQEANRRVLEKEKGVQARIDAALAAAAAADAAGKGHETARLQQLEAALAAAHAQHRAEQAEAARLREAVQAKDAEAKAARQALQAAKAELASAQGKVEPLEAQVREAQQAQRALERQLEVATAHATRTVQACRAEAAEERRAWERRCGASEALRQDGAVKLKEAELAVADLRAQLEALQAVSVVHPTADGVRRDPAQARVAELELELEVERKKVAKALLHERAQQGKRLEEEVARLRAEVSARLPVVAAAALQQVTSSRMRWPSSPSWPSATVMEVEEEKEDEAGSVVTAEGSQQGEEEEEKRSATTAPMTLREECRRAHAALRAEIAALRRHGFYCARPSTRSQGPTIDACGGFLPSWDVPRPVRSPWARSSNSSMYSAPSSPYPLLGRLSAAAAAAAGGGCGGGPWTMYYM